MYPVSPQCIPTLRFDQIRPWFTSLFDRCFVPSTQKRDLVSGQVVLPPVASSCVRGCRGTLSAYLGAHLKGHCIEFKYYADGIHSGLTPPG